MASSVSEATSSDAALRRFLHGLPGVDQVGAEQRAASLGTRSIKTSAKAYAIDLAIRMVDLTTLEGNDTSGKVRTLCAKAMRPDPTDPDCPSTAAVCVYPDMVGTAKAALGSSGVNVAAVAGQDGSDGSGCMALAASARTLPSVSWPSRVVRSTIEIARSRA